MTKTQMLIYEFICEHKQATLDELEKGTGKKKNHLSNILHRLIELGEITRVDLGTYKVEGDGINGLSDLSSEKSSDETTWDSDAHNEQNQYTSEFATRYMEKLESDIEKLETDKKYLKERIENLEKMLDQEQQLHLITKNEILHLEKSPRPGVISWLSGLFKTPT